ncbi:MAG: outer membrane protein assembly factor [Verrucomicrobiales bacterium]
MSFRFFWFCAVWLGTVACLSAANAPDAEVLRVSAQGVVVELRGVGRARAADAIRVVEEQLGLARDSAVSAPLADDLAFFVRGRYLQLGHAQARVDWSLESGIVILTVEEGPGFLVGAIRIGGVDESLSNELQGYLLRPTREREGTFSRGLPFVEADVRAGVDLALRYLQSQGYLGATAGPPVFSAGTVPGRMDIEVDVELGVRSLFGDVALVGDGEPISTEARAEVEALEGRPFSEAALESARASLRGEWQRRGYFTAEVTAAAGTVVVGTGSVNQVPVTFTATPGKRYAVRAVSVDEAFGRGASRVAEAVFSSVTDQTYAPEALDLVHRRALDTGLFSQLEVNPVIVSENMLDLRISGEEAVPKTLGFYGGYESLLGAILGLEARHVNFLDSGNSAALRLEYRGTGGESGVQFNDPAVFGSRWSLGTGATWETFTFKDYDRQTAAWRSSLTRRLTRRITAEVFSELSYSELDTEVLTPTELGPGRYGTASGGVRLTFDYRDHPLLARQGWLLGLSAEGGLINGDENVSFVRGELNAGWYRALSERWRFALGARARVLLTPSEVSDIPIDLRLFNGGATSVRSFAERELGPMSAKGDTPLGGLATGTVSAELSYEPIRNLEVAAFADAGSLGEDAATYSRTDDLRYGIGLGVRYRLPVGPLRIDYGINPDRREGEDFGAWHLTFGFAF